MRPGTLVLIVALLVAIVVFAILLITYDGGRAEPPRPLPTSVSP